MENPPQLQLFQGLVFFSAGVAAGLVYDVCRALRRCCGSAVKLWADILFGAGLCVALFVLGMLVGNGQLRLFMPLAAACGGAGYSRLCSGYTVPVFIRGVRVIFRVLSVPKQAVEKLKKFLKSEKKLFPKR